MALSPTLLVGRDDELRSVAALLRREPGLVRALVLQGEAGVGKTSLWEQGVAWAREQGLRVLVTRASEAETALPFAGLIDLLDGVPSEELGDVPAPQRRALDVALYRIEPADRPPEEQVIALGLLSALRALAARQPLVVAVDDVQWLDRTSEEALAYATRRLYDEPVSLLLARRPGRRSGLEKAFPDDRLDRVLVEPLSLGALRRLLARRLDLRLPGHLLERVHRATLGNPLFAVELGRTLVGRDLEALDGELPLPENVDEMLGLRVADLDTRVQRVLLALALDADIRVTQLREAGAVAVADATEAGVVVVDGDRVRPAHPLLAAAARRRASAAEQRELHAGLAEVVGDEQRRALHLALATLEPDEELAARLSAAAATASAHGATRLAVELATHTHRLTPPDEPDDGRVLALGEYLQNAGEKRRLTDLLTPRVESMSSQEDRVAAYLLLTDGEVTGNDEIIAFLERALAAAGDDRPVRGRVLRQLIESAAVISVRDIAREDARAAEVLAESEHDDPEDHWQAVYTYTWTSALRGRPVADLVRRFNALGGDAAYLGRNPRRPAGQQSVWRGELDDARALLEAFRQETEDRAEPRAAALARLHLCELELRAGQLDRAQALLDEWAASTDSDLLLWPMFERCRALAAATRGDVADAREWGRRAADRAERTGVGWDRLEATRALGLAALLSKDVDEAVRHLSVVWEHTLREGVLDPGTFPAGPDLVEALVEAASYDAARAVVDVLADRAEGQDHPWARIGAARGAAVLALHDDGYGDEAVSALEAAAAAYRERGLLYDEARTLLSLGRVQRRERKWGAARTTLERALAAFEAIGSSGWAEDVRAELERVGARRPTSEGGLTPTERRVADLAIQGLSNKEIARNLVVTVNTVEFHLRNTYAKLGIRSRAQLATGLRGLENPQP